MFEIAKNIAKPAILLSILILLAVTTLGIAHSAAASSAVPGKCSGGKCEVDPATKPCDSDSCDFIGKYINPGINLLTATFGIVATGSLIFGGIQYSSSGGDPQKITQAKNRIRNTIIAVVAYLFLFGFLQFLVPGGLFNRT